MMKFGFLAVVLALVTFGLKADQSFTCGVLPDGNIHGCGPESQFKAIGDNAGFNSRVTQWQPDNLAEGYWSVSGWVADAATAVERKWSSISTRLVNTTDQGMMTIMRLNNHGVDGQGTRRDDLWLKGWSHNGAAFFYEGADNTPPGNKAVRIYGNGGAYVEIRDGDVYRPGDMDGLFARIDALEAAQSPPTVIESDGDYSLLVVGGNYVIGHPSGAQTELTYTGGNVGPNTWTGWTALHVEDDGPGFKVLWDNPGDWRIWDVDASGYYSGAGEWVSDLGPYEPLFEAELP